MKQLYMVRRNLEIFLGPMTAAEVQICYRKMQFGLEDEVAGSLGPWLTLDDGVSVRRNYPELAKVLHEELKGVWQASDHVAKRVQSQDAQAPADSSRKRRLILAFAFLILGVAAAVAAVFLAKTARLSAHLGPQPDTQGILEAQAMLEHDDGLFLTYMDERLPSLVQDLRVASSGAAQDWLPYLRAYAFLKDGQISGLNARLLKGDTSAASPDDCSVKSWQKRWHDWAHGLGAVFSGAKLPRHPAIKILTWDPHWLRRRHTSGWIKPRHYYEACLLMALKATDGLVDDAKLQDNGALAAQSLDAARQALELQGKVRQRLAWSLEISQGHLSKPHPRTAQANDMLDMMSCFEAADSGAAIAKCREGATFPSAWRDVLEDHYGWNMVRISVHNRELGDLQKLNELSDLVNKLNHGDGYAKLDYKPEFDFMKEIFKSKGLIDEAIRHVQSSYPDVSFKL